MKCPPPPLPPFLSFSLYLGYGSNRLKLANLEDFDLGQSWNSNLIPISLSLKIKIVQAMRLQVSSNSVTGRGDLILIVVYKLVRNY